MITKNKGNFELFELLITIIEANFIFSSSLIPNQFPFSKDCLNEPKLIIRHAYLKDIYELAEVLTQSFYSSHGLLCWLYPLFKLGVCEDIRNRLNSRSTDYSCLVAMKTTKDGDGEIVGTAEVGIRSSSFLSTSDFKYPYISNLAVKTSCRRQGIARQLLIKCEQTALLWGFSEICLHVLENNHQAKQLYFTNGYKTKQIESSLSDYLTQRPRRLLLSKQLHSDKSVSNSQLVKHIKYC
jgi:ribosomal protein S18 acetylase RimI-like enzyme